MQQQTPDSLDHPYFQHSRPWQRRREWQVIGLLVMGCLFLAALAIGTGLYGLGLLIFIPLQLAAPFLDTPAGIRKGTLHYAAPLCILQPVKDKGHILHGGTLFDYWYVLRAYPSLRFRKKRLFHDMVSGLRREADRAHSEERLDQFVRGTSYFINPRTAQRFGLQPVSRDWGQTLILWFNAAQITAAYSLIQGRLAWPPLHRVQTYAGTWRTIRENRKFLEALEGRLYLESNP
jgi:hypothetical protein